MRFALEFTLLVNPTSPFSSHAPSLVFILVVTNRKIHQVLSNFGVSKPPGLDGIPPMFLKELCFRFSLHITPSFFNQCTFHSSWENMGTSNPNKHHSLTLISIVSKVFEAVISKHLRPFLEREDLLSDS